MDPKIIKDYVKKIFPTEFLPTLMNFIRIPNISPSYDPQWRENKYLLKAAELIMTFGKGLQLKNTQFHLLMDEGKTPFVFIDVAASRPNDSRTVLMYGHFDKQPPFSGWDDDKGPTKPVIKDGLLYGRGSADDGYCPFTCLLVVKYCQEHNLPLPRICLTFEGNEESGEDDLIYYINKLKPIIGDVTLFLCLDAGCDDYDRLWLTTSLRGCIYHDYTIKTVSEELPESVYGGIVPDPFMAFRKLFDKIQDEKGDIKIPGMSLDIIPEKRLKDAKKLAEIVGEKYKEMLPLYKPTKPLHDDVLELVLNKTWRPSVTITGIDGIPSMTPQRMTIPNEYKTRLSYRIPPGIDGVKADEDIKKFVTENIPFGATITVSTGMHASGWEMRDHSKSVEKLLMEGSKLFYGNEVAYRGEGGSIPFNEYFETLYPTCDICNLGISGPESNDHGPNENMSIDACEKLMMCLIYLIGNY